VNSHLVRYRSTDVPIPKVPGRSNWRPAFP
jgi:hypothetical protein